MGKIQFTYRNHRNEVAVRTVEVVSLDYVAEPHLEFGYGPGFFLHCRDYTDGREGLARSFALHNIQMEGFAIGKGVAPAWRLMLSDEPISVGDVYEYEGKKYTLTGSMRKVTMGPHRMHAEGNCLRGVIYGHHRFPDGTPDIITSVIVAEIQPDVFLTKSGSVYKVETWESSTQQPK